MADVSPQSPTGEYGWYVLYVPGGNEEAIRNEILQMIPDSYYSSCIILYAVSKKRYLGKWHEERRKLYPGYLFIITDQVEEFRGCLKGLYHYARLLGTEDELLPVTKEEEKILRKLSGYREDATSTVSLDVEMSYGMIEGERIVITSGPLEGLEGFIKKVDRHRREAILEMQMFGSVRTVTVGLEIIRKNTC